MNRLLYLKKPAFSSLNINFLLNNSPKYFIQKRFDSTSSTNIQHVKLIAPESETMINTTVDSTNRVGFITDSPITHTFEDLLMNLHDSLSLEWSSTIFLAAFLFRLSIGFPIRIYQEHLMAKLAELQPKIKEATEKSIEKIRKSSVFLTPELKRKIFRQVFFRTSNVYNIFYAVIFLRQLLFAMISIKKRIVNLTKFRFHPFCNCHFGCISHQLLVI